MPVCHTALFMQYSRRLVGFPAKARHGELVAAEEILSHSQIACVTALTGA